MFQTFWESLRNKRKERPFWTHQFKKHSNIKDLVSPVKNVFLRSGLTNQVTIYMAMDSPSAFFTCGLAVIIFGKIWEN